MGKSMLEVKGLTKKFGDFTAVNNLTFSVDKGEVFGFLGPNGAGKTTTMRMITNFIPATSGEILVDGIGGIENDILVRRKIGYLPESTPLYGDMFVEEYLKFVGELRGLKGSKLKTQYEKMIEVCDLKKMIKRPVAYLSKGYRQRVGLAQAMIHEPDLLILDEPISGLDPNQIVEIRNLIKEIGKEKTVLYCSHILSEVEATCDRLLIIKRGTIVAKGTSEEVTNEYNKETLFTLKARGELKNFVSILKNQDKIIDVTVEHNTLFIKSNEGDEYGEIISQLAFENGVKIRELVHNRTTLEDVFTSLTGGNE